MAILSSKAHPSQPTIKGVFFLFISGIQGGLCTQNAGCQANLVCDGHPKKCQMCEMPALIIGGNNFGGNDGLDELEAFSRVEVVSLNPTSNCTNCRKVVGNIPAQIKGAVGTTFGELMVIKATV